MHDIENKILYDSRIMTEGRTNFIQKYSWIYKDHNEWIKPTLAPNLGTMGNVQYIHCTPTVNVR